MPPVYSPNIELIEIVNERNIVTEATPRNIMRSDNLIHRAAYVFVFSPLGSLCVQQRSASKDIFPNQWDLAAGGIPAVGESYADAAQRELGEELGIYHQKLNSHGEFYHADEHCRVWGSIYSLIWDGGITPQADEISQWRYLSTEDIPLFLGTEQVTPTTLKAYHRLLGLD